MLIGDSSSSSRPLLVVIIYEPPQPLAALVRPLVTPLRDPTEQQDVGLPLMIPLGMVMRHILTQRSPQGALTKDNDLRQTLLLDRSHPAFGIGVQVRASRRQRERLDPA